MSNYESPLGSLSSGGTLHTDTGGSPTPPPRKTPWAAIVVVAAVVLVLVAIVAGAALLLLSGGGDDDDGPVASTTEGPAGTEDHIEERDVQPRPEEPADPAPEETPREEEPRERPSLLSERGTSAALRELRSAAKGKAITLRVDRERITVVAEGNVLIYDSEGKLQKLPGPPSVPIGFSLDDVDPRAPARIDGALREKGERLDYLAFVINPVTDEGRWSVFAKGGKSYSADASGRNLCPLGQQC
jgi:hypothetical protein